MDALSIIDNYRTSYRKVPSIMVSGIDETVKRALFRKWFDMVYALRTPHIVIDLSRTGEMKNILQQFGVNIGASIPGSNCFSMFDGDDFESEDRLRVRMSNAGWSNEKKDKAIAYMLFLQHINHLETGQMESFGMNLMAKYSSPKDFEYVIKQLYDQGIIEYYEQLGILGKYSELSSVAPDLEALLMAGSITQGMNNERELRLESLRGNNVAYIHIGRMRDEYSRLNILNAIKGKIDNYSFSHANNNSVITIYGKGKMNENVISDFVNDMEEDSQILLVSDNVFGIRDNEEIQQNFPMRIFSRHDIMDAAEKVQNTFGNIYIRKKTYATARDMHMKSRGILDRIMGTDVVKTETISEPQPEAKYRKEEIMAYLPGQCIVSYAGQDMLTQLYV